MRWGLSIGEVEMRRERGFWSYFVRTMSIYLMWMMSLAAFVGELPSLWVMAVFALAASMWVQSE
jgi:hypothetical protein